MPDHPKDEALEREQIAQHLEARRDGIVADWLIAVQEDDGIPSADRLTIGALRDHFPEMFTELIAAVRDEYDGETQREARKTAREHGKSRWRSGYRLDELLRELARVREMILDHVAQFCRNRISANVTERTGETIRSLFDSIVAGSAQQYVNAQEAELILRARQLQHAYELVQAATGQMRLVAESRLGLLRAVSHELRNALEPVSLTAALLLDEGHPSDRRELADRLSRVSLRLQTLLDRLRELSMLLAGEARPQPEKMSLAELLRDLEEKHGPRAEKKGLRFETQLSIDTPEITSDREKLHAIGENLISNAIQFTDAGFVRLEILTSNDERWILRISDSGRGIDPSERKHIFQEIHSASNTQPTGARLGLIITRHLAHVLDGEITFQSTPGEGSCFEVNLPRVLFVRDGGIVE